MKAQVSLEFMFVLAVFTACLLVITPQVIKLQETSSLALKADNAKSILNTVYYACERAKITGEEQGVEVNALGDYDITANSSHLLLSFENRAVSKSVSFECPLSIRINKGINQLSISPNST